MVRRHFAASKLVLSGLFGKVGQINSESYFLESADLPFLYGYRNSMRNDQPKSRKACTIGIVQIGKSCLRYFALKNQISPD
jgi:hypothetical protein